MHAPKEGETHLLLNMMKDLDINSFLDKYRNADLFKKVVEGMKEGSCVCHRLR